MNKILHELPLGHVFLVRTTNTPYWDNGTKEADGGYPLYVCEDGSLEVELNDNTPIVDLGPMQNQWLRMKDGLVHGFTIPAEVLNGQEGKAAWEYEEGEWFIAKSGDIEEVCYRCRRGAGCIMWSKFIDDKYRVLPFIEDQLKDGKAWSRFQNCLPYIDKPPFVISDGEEWEKIESDIATKACVKLRDRLGIPTLDTKEDGVWVKNDEYETMVEDKQLLQFLLTNATISMPDQFIIESIEDIKQAMGEGEIKKSNDTWKQSDAIKDHWLGNDIQPPQDHGAYQPLVDAASEAMNCIDCSINAEEWSRLHKALRTLPTPSDTVDTNSDDFKAGESYALKYINEQCFDWKPSQQRTYAATIRRIKALQSDDTTNVPKKFVEDVRELYCKADAVYALCDERDHEVKDLKVALVDMQSTLNEMGGEG